MGVAVLCLEAVAYTRALGYLDVSEAYAMGSLNLIAVAMALSPGSGFQSIRY